MTNPSYVLLEKITVGAAGASSVTFSGIPQTGYTDLLVKLSARTNRSAIEEAIFIQFNNSGGTDYSSRRLFGTGTTAASDSGSSQSSAVFYSVNGDTSTSSTFGSAEIYIPNYAGSTSKSISVDAITENNATAVTTGLMAGLWANSAAITSVKLTGGSSGTFVQGTTFYLYGVAKLGTTPAIVPYATGGDTIMTDGTYWYHAFTSSGTFTPQKSLSCDYLVVAGGGGANNDSSGGGGAGGMRCTVTSTGGTQGLETALTLNGTTNYTVTVGAGGAYANDGNNSVFSTITSTGGGCAGGNVVHNGRQYSGGDGGSGGGGSGGGTSTGGAGLSNQGRAGGNGRSAAPNYPGGGGGGAGSLGVNPASGSDGGGNGGSGVATVISGSSVTYAGGGGGNGGASTTGGTGGSGGGGNGGFAGNHAAAQNGTVNTGGGAGGGNSTEQRAGGSGVVIIRYAV